VRGRKDVKRLTVMAKENMNDQNEDDLESISTVEVNSSNLDQDSFLRQK